ncbi:ABC transporter substrate-binding protein [Streptomyces hygroscopicus]|uniref:ABC transporter substrate-binding protein n=1 Tax=Streptomyces hygroscopicus TaxID=1912 RepID=UPI0036C3DCB3
MTRIETRIPFGPALSRRSVLRLGAGASAGIALAPLAGCAGPTGAPGPGAISLGLNRSLVSLDNKLNQFDAAVTVQRAVRQALTRIGKGLRPELVLADRFEMTEPTAWTVRLRRGARYSDGTPVTVKDVSTALKMYAGVNGSFIVGLFPEMPTVEPVDERTFRLHTERPVPILDQLMANILISPAAANRPGELSGGVGSGPYVVTSANSGTGEYSLAANPRYWGRRPAVERVRVRFVPEESSRVVAVRSGELDVIDTITPDSAEQLKGLPGVRLDRTSGTRVNQLFFNFRKPRGHPLADARVREALSYAIDGESLVRDVLTGSAQQAEGVVPLALKGSVRTGRYVHDPGKARKRLAALGASDLKVKIIWESGEFPADTSVMEAVLEMLRAVGVRATLQQFEPGGDILQWRQGRRGDWDVLGNGFSVPPATPPPVSRACTAAPRRRRRPATPTRATSSPRSPPGWPTPPRKPTRRRGTRSSPPSRSGSGTPGPACGPSSPMWCWPAAPGCATWACSSSTPTTSPPCGWRAEP